VKVGNGPEIMLSRQAASSIFVKLWKRGNERK
jgi:hypothetical protein